MMIVGMFVVFMMCLVMVMVSKWMEQGSEEMSSYECGFDPIVESRKGFSYRFFLISILFLIFDVEIALLLPVPLKELSWEMMMGVMFFMLVLLGGLIYEYSNGVLMWL